MIAEGELLMNGVTADWPPRDMNGRHITIGCQVYGTRDTYAFAHEHEFTVGSLRLQNVRGCLEWVVCAYDDADHYFEAFAEDCAVTKAAPAF